MLGLGLTAGMLALPATAQEAYTLQDLSAPSAAPAQSKTNHSARSRLNLVVDPSFEGTPGILSDNPNWEEFGAGLPNNSPFCAPDCFGGAELARTGIYHTIFGLADVTGMFYIAQDVALPGPGDYELEFYWAGGVDRDAEPEESAVGALRAIVGTDTVYTLEAAEAPNYSLAYRRVVIPFTAASDTVTVRIELENVANPGNGDVYQVLIDDVSVRDPNVIDPFAEINTGNILTGLFDNGNFADADCSGLPGFKFNDEELICGSVLQVGLSPDNVIGWAYQGTGQDSEWAPGAAGTAESFPYDGLDRGVTATFSDAAGLGIDVTASAYWVNNSDYILLDYAIVNNTGSDVSDAFAGLYADWDVANYSSNEAIFDAANGYYYVWDGSTPTSDYVGQAFLNSTVDGWDCRANHGDDEGAIYSGLTTPGDATCARGDFFGILGTGLGTLAPGDTARVLMGIVAGESREDWLANLNELRDLVNPPQVLSIDTGTLQTSLFPNGAFGDNDCDPGTGGGLFFEGGQYVLCGAVFQLGINPDLVFGVPYESGDGAEWVPVGSGVASSFPYDGLDRGVFATFEDAQALGVRVTATAYWQDGSDFVVLDYTIENTLLQNLEDMAVGMWFDWDIDNYAQNASDVDVDRNLQWVWDSSDPSSQYFGQMFLGSDLLGYNCFLDYGASANDNVVWNAMISPTDMPCSPVDVRGPIGTGPVTIAAGQSETITIAVVAGSSAADLIENADAARIAYGKPVGTDSPAEAATASALSKAYPNPTSGRVQVDLSVVTAQHVRVAVYDALGRQVAVVLDGPVSPGTQALTVDAGALPTGMYFIRAAGESFSSTQRVTVVH